jgi:hypothetical protein
MREEGREEREMRRRDIYNTVCAVLCVLCTVANTKRLFLPPLPPFFLLPPPFFLLPPSSSSPQRSSVKSPRRPGWVSPSSVASSPSESPPCYSTRSTVCTPRSQVGGTFNKSVFDRLNICSLEELAWGGGGRERETSAPFTLPAPTTMLA